jgi:hypothetical protein
LLEKLEGETYLIKNGKTIKSIVEAKVIEFENGPKRFLDMTDRNLEMEPIYIDDLRENFALGFRANNLFLSR